MRNRHESLALPEAPAVTLDIPFSDEAPTAVHRAQAGPFEICRPPSRTWAALRRRKPKRSLALLIAKYFR